MAKKNGLLFFESSAKMETKKDLLKILNYIFEELDRKNLLMAQLETNSDLNSN